jgi:asparagine synthase (glutamine-hydrolysing)
MCGIAGILGEHAGADVSEMTAALRHRGPDRQASIALPHAHVGAARLRIVDLTAGDQPLVSSRTGAVLVFNGEIYNYPALRAHLEARGHRFETHTDSEVVLRGYEEYGWRCVEHLRGMYAFAIVDGDRAVLARDPLGIKPLHYCTLRGGRALAFASEIKSLLRCAEVPARLDEATLGDLHALEYVADPRATLFDGIACLEPGTCLEIALAGGGLAVQTHRFVPDLAPLDPVPTIDEAEEQLDTLLQAAVRSHQMADVPICLTLSGGLDSTLLALFLRQQVAGNIISYIVSDTADHADVVQARQAARLLGLEHREVLLTFADYLAGVAPSVLACETPTDGVGQYCLFHAIGREFRVAFNGEGADELFGGYPEHWSAAHYIDRLRHAPAGLPMTERGAAERDRLLAAAVADSDRWMLDHFMGSQLVDRHLHPLDKYGMASSVEVRVPYLDYDVAMYAKRLPAAYRVNRALGSLKYILRRVYLRRWRSLAAGTGLTDAVLRAKFGFPDSRRASEQRFHELCNRVLPDSYLASQPWGRYAAHKKQALWFDLFQALFCEHRGVLPSGFDLLDFMAARAGMARATVVAIAGAVAGGGAPSAGARPPRPRPAVADAAANPAARELADRLAWIVAAVGARAPQTNDEEIWFTTPSTGELEIRLSADRAGPCYDRSANFAISYGGQSDAPVDAAFAQVVAAIQKVDAAPLEDVTGQFAIAARQVVGEADGAAHDPVAEGGVAAAASGGEAPSNAFGWDYRPIERRQPPVPSGSRWERALTRKLNVVFLDLCAPLIADGREPLSPLHWGFWPAGASAAPPAPDYNPFEAFSENLLRYIPAAVGRVMDVGCGRGANTRLLAARRKRVTAVSPIAHHCELIASAGLPGVDVQCARFEELAPPAEPYDLLLFSESLNHFSLEADFFAHCRTFLGPGGYMLMADDLDAEHMRRITSQRLFRVLQAVDITENVAPTVDWWAQQMRTFVPYREALLSVLDLHDAAVGERVRRILDDLDSSELRVLFSGQPEPPVSKGRYMIYLLQRD